MTHAVATASAAAANAAAMNTSTKPAALMAAYERNEALQGLREQLDGLRRRPLARHDLALTVLDQIKRLEELSDLYGMPAIVLHWLLAVLMLAGVAMPTGSPVEKIASITEFTWPSGTTISISSSHSTTFVLSLRLFETRATSRSLAGLR